MFLQSISGLTRDFFIGSKSNKFLPRFKVHYVEIIRNRILITHTITFAS